MAFRDDCLRNTELNELISGMMIKRNLKYYTKHGFIFYAAPETLGQNPHVDYTACLSILASSKIDTVQHSTGRYRVSRLPPSLREQ